MPRKKKNGSTHGTNAYPENVPLNDEGGPADEVDEEFAKTNPLDVESARVNDEHERTMKRKAAGDKRVPWSADYAIRFMQVKQFHPNAKVRIEQKEPEEDESIPGMSLTVFRDYDDLKAYVRKFWKGEGALYKWTVWDHTRPPGWTVGFIRFREDPNWSASDKRSRRDEPQQQYAPQPQQYAPQQYLPNPAYPQPVYVAPFVQQPQQPAHPEPQPQPQQQYAMPGLTTDFLNQMLQNVQQATARAAQLEEHQRGEALRQQLADITRQLEQLRAQPPPQTQQGAIQPQYLDWWLNEARRTLQPQPQPAAAPSPTQPVVPMSPLKQMEETISVVKALAHVNRELQMVVAPPDKDEVEQTLNQNSEESPYHIQATPLMDIVTDKRTGQRADGFTHLLFNSGKASAFLERAMTQGRGMMKDRSEDAIRMMRAQAEAEEISLRTQERKARLLEEQRTKQLRDLQKKAEYEERLTAALAARASVGAAPPMRPFPFPIDPPPFAMPNNPVVNSNPVLTPFDTSPHSDLPQPPTMDESLQIPPIIEPQDMGVPPAPAAGGFPSAPDLPSPSGPDAEPEPQ